MRTRHGFLKSIYFDGYKIVSIAAPVLSISFTVAKALELPVELKELSYAWAFAPLTIWFLVAYVRRWQYSEKMADLIVPKISLSDPIAYTEPKGTEGRATRRTYKIDVTNTSTVTVTGCQVKLLEMLNVENVLSKEHGRPFKLTLENRNDAAYSKSFDISPGDSVSIDLVQYKEIQAGPHIRMCYAIQPEDSGVFTNVPVDVCPHNITIRAVAENLGTPIDKKLKVFVNNKGCLTVVSKQ